MEPTSPHHPDNWNRINVPPRVAERAAANVDLDENGCWISRYSRSRNGYSQIGWSEQGERHMVTGHRASWVRVNGQVPLGMTIDHLCKQRMCVNPDHMRLLPNFENARRIDGKDWPIGTCANGHPATELKMVRKRTKSGKPRIGRVCRQCVRAYQRKYSQSHREQLAQSQRDYRERKRAERKEAA